MIIEKKCCENCGDSINGRSDKKFCNDYCRNAFNNKLSNGSAQQTRPIIAALIKNRRILQEAFKKNDGELLDKKTLAILGFDPRYCTEHKQINGENYYFSFDVGFKDCENGQIRLLSRGQFVTLSNTLPDLTLQLMNGIESPGKENHLRKNR